MNLTIVNYYYNHLVLILLVLLLTWTNSYYCSMRLTNYKHWRTIYEQINHEPNYSQFNSHLQYNRIAINYLHRHNITIFLPDNQAFDRSTIINDDNTFILYHITATPIHLNEFMNATTIKSIDSIHYHDYPPLWIHYDRINRDYYVNNARIMINKSDQQQSNHLYKNQV